MFFKKNVNVFPWILYFDYRIICMYLLDALYKKKLKNKRYLKSQKMMFATSCDWCSQQSPKGTKRNVLGFSPQTGEDHLPVFIFHFLADIKYHFFNTASSLWNIAHCAFWNQLLVVFFCDWKVFIEFDWQRSRDTSTDINFIANCLSKLRTLASNFD